MPPSHTGAPRQQRTRRGCRSQVRRRCHTSIARLLHALQDCLPSSLHLPEVLQAVTRGAVQLFQVPAASLWGVDEVTERLYLRSSWGEALTPTLLPQSIAWQHDAVGWVARHRQPLFVADVLTEQRFTPLPHWHQHGLRSFAGFPLFLDATLLAVLAWHGTSPFVLSPTRQHLLHFFLTQVCTALHNAQLYASETSTRQTTESSLYAQAAMAVRNASLYATESMARNAIEAATRTKNALLANMSHALRTPLNAIINYSEMLEEDATAQDHPGYVPDLKKIQLAGKTLLGRINDILDFARVEAGEVHVQRETFDVASLIQDVLEMLQPLAAKNVNTLAAHVDDEITQAYGDRTKIQQSLLHLLSNACKFTSQGHITVRVSQEPLESQTWLRFQVHDTGIGMSPEQVARLFQPFMQADDSSTRKYGGTGMGLAISQRLCKMMGGEITVTSTEGQGSTFTMYLPVICHTAPALS